jgi:hypothetical protein
MRRKNIITVLVIVMSLWSDSICKEMLDLKLGIFSIKDVYGKKTYIGFPEIKAGFSDFITENITIGFELDYYVLPKNYDLWGATIDSEINIVKNFVDIGWLVQQNNGYIGVVLGYDFGVDIFSYIIFGSPHKLPVGTYQLVITKEIKLKDNKSLKIDVGIQEHPVEKISIRFGLGL